MITILMVCAVAIAIAYATIIIAAATFIIVSLYEVWAWESRRGGRW